jgi:pimeloyl-ACP methyl ester carboxylesterase
MHGTGRSLVVLPWFGFDHAVMEAAFEPVFAGITGWRRIYVDLPGTGALMPVEPSSDAVLAAVSATVSEIIGGDGSALVAGCSYGGYLAAGLARRTPTLVSGCSPCAQA